MGKLKIKIVGYDNGVYRIEDINKRVAVVSEEQLNYFIREKKVDLYLPKILCIGKYRDKYNRITGYRVQTTNRETYYVSAANLKIKIQRHMVNCMNLRLSTDGRLVSFNTDVYGKIPELQKFETDEYCIINSRALTELSSIVDDLEYGLTFKKVADNDKDYETLVALDVLTCYKGNLNLLNRAKCRVNIDDEKKLITVFYWGEKVLLTGSFNCYDFPYITSLDLSNVIIDKQLLNDGFLNMPNLETIKFGKYQYDTLDNLRLVVHGGQLPKIKELDLSNFYINKLFKMNSLLCGLNGLQKFRLGKNINTTYVTDTHNMFKHCINLDDIDISEFRLYGVTDMSGMFLGCGKLVSRYGIRWLNTENVADMSYMFANCGNVEIDGLKDMNTSSVTDIKGMFKGTRIPDDMSWLNMKYIKSVSELFSYSGEYDKINIDINTLNLDTKYVTNFSSLFYGRVGTIKNLDKLDISNAVDMNYMLANTNTGSSSIRLKITSTKIQNVDSLLLSSAFRNIEIVFPKTMNNLHSLSSMFYGCSNLENVKFTNLDYGNIDNLSYLFCRCEKLVNIDWGYNVRASRIKNVESMFSNTKKLINLDLSMFKFRNAFKANEMFYKSNIETIKIYNNNPVVIRACIDENKSRQQDRNRVRSNIGVYDRQDGVPNDIRILNET